LASAGDGLDWPAGPCHPSLLRQATGYELDLRNIGVFMWEKGWLENDLSQ